MAALELLTQLVYLLSVVVTVRLWLQTRTQQAAWSAATFGALGIVLVIVLVAGPDAEFTGAMLKAILVVVLLIPWLLFRFADSIVRAPVGVRRFLDVVGLATVLSSFAVSSIAQDVAERTTAQTVWAAAIALNWLILATATTSLFWLASRGKPGLTRGRLRMLAVGSLLLGLSVTASSGGAEDGAAALTSQLLSMGAAITFLLGYAPPSLLRAAWRSSDERDLHSAAVSLLVAKNQDDVTSVLLPGVRSLLGAPGVGVLREDGQLGVVDGQPPAVGTDTTASLAMGPWNLVYELAPSMPAFGGGERELVDRLGLLATLASERVRLVEAEQAARVVAEEAVDATAVANAELEAVNQELEAFVYTASHDLKNPVIAILGYLDVLEQDYADAFVGDTSHYLDRMGVNARFMQQLINDLLELSRVGRVDTAPSLVDSASLVEMIAMEADRRHEEVSLNVGGYGDLPNLWANPTRLRQFFENLVENSCRYAGRNDITIDITCEPTDDGLRIDFCDNGRGIPSDQVERIFGMFERLDPGETLGTGMGLAICRRIIVDLGGTVVAVPSEVGAHLRIDLPNEVVRADRQSAEAVIEVAT